MKRTAKKRVADPLAEIPAVAFAIPKFANEGEEAEWWRTHRREADELFARAHKVGAVRRFQGGIAAPTRQTTIRLIARDVERARMIASKKGLRYQTYIKMLVHEGLDREEGPAEGRGNSKRRASMGSGMGVG